MIFTEFLELVEARMGVEMVDHIITDAQLPNQGAYTSVGTYDHAEIVRLVTALSQRAGIPVPQLLHLFGEHLFQRFSAAYPNFFVGACNTFDFLATVEKVIHVEVRKLYPTAELPGFTYTLPTANEMVMTYSSPRGMGDLAEGLIRGCIAYFNESIDIKRVDLPPCDGCQQVRFHLLRTG